MGLANVSLIAYKHVDVVVIVPLFVCKLVANPTTSTTSLEPLHTQDLRPHGHCIIRSLID